MKKNPQYTQGSGQTDWIATFTIGKGSGRVVTCNLFTHFVSHWVSVEVFVKSFSALLNSKSARWCPSTRFHSGFSTSFLLVSQYSLPISSRKGFSVGFTRSLYVSSPTPIYWGTHYDAHRSINTLNFDNNLQQDPHSIQRMLYDASVFFLRGTFMMLGILLCSFQYRSCFWHGVLLKNCKHVSHLFDF